MQSLGKRVLLQALVTFLFSLGVVYLVLYFAVRNVYIHQMERTLEGVSKQVFSSMYQVMKRGWKREDLFEFLRSIETSYHETPLIVNVYRGEKVRSLFGDVPEPEKSKEVLRALKEKMKLSLLRENESIYIYPIGARSECLRCHVNAKEGDILGVIEARFNTGAVLTTMNRKILTTLIFLLPINILFATLLAYSIRKTINKVSSSLRNAIGGLSSIEDIDKVSITNEVPYREFKDLERSIAILANKVKEIAVDKSILELETKILEKFIVTSELVNDWRKYVGKLLEDVNEIIELNVIFSLFIEGDTLSVEVFWLHSPSEEMKNFSENIIHREVISRLPVTSLSGKELIFHHHVHRENERLTDVEEEMLRLRTKVLLLEKPQLGGIVGVGLNSELAQDTYKHTVLDAILATLINVIGSAKAISTHVQEVEFYAMRDSLTFLYNQRTFWELFNYELERAERFGRKLSLMLLDLDNFKVINDTYGHVFGDTVLREVGRIIYEKKRKADVAARYGGDEFALLVVGAGVTEAYSLAKRIKEAIENLTFIAEEDKVINVEVSIGISTFPDHAKNPRDLFILADNLLRKAKEEGRSRLKVPSYEDLSKIGSFLTEKSIQILDALNKREIVPYFQPIVDLNTGKVFANEALMRIGKHRLPAAAFIEAAENLGVLVRMDLILYEEVFKKIKEQGYKKKIFLNFSPRVLLLEDFSSRLSSLVEGLGISPGNVVFELTERESVRNIELLEKFVKVMKENGFKFAIDDFGSGYSSFYYLKRVPVDYVKMEGEFVKDIVSDWRDRSFIASIVALAKGMGIKTVAEFVEGEDILNYLRELGVDYGQGFYFGKPSPELKE